MMLTELHCTCVSEFKMQDPEEYYNAIEERNIICKSVM